LKYLPVNAIVCPEVFRLCDDIESTPTRQTAPFPVSGVTVLKNDGMHVAD
jgi:hypothetical protein